MGSGITERVCEKMAELIQARKRDASAIAALEKRLFTDYWTESGISETIRQEHAQVILAKTDGWIIGYCILYQSFDQGEIIKIAVAPEHQHQGVGRQLLAEAEAVSSECEIQSLFLEVRESNANARGFYQHLGFEEVGIRRDFYQKPRENAVLMKKDLD